MSTTDGHFRVGIIGTGALGTMIGEQFYARPEARVRALTDVDAASRTAAGRRLEVAEDHQYDSYEAMLSGEDLDGVVIATPHALHYEQITAALDRDLHVLCEKPLVLQADRAREIADRAEAEDRVVMVGYQRHLDQSYRLVRERYAGAGPDVEFVTAEITQDWFDAFGDSWRADYDLSGGGFLTDTGRHVVDAVLWVTGLDPVAVTAQMEFRDPHIDERGDVRIEFEGGATASISLFGDAAGVRESYHFWDSEGAAFVRGREWDSRTLHTIDEEGTEHDPYLDRRAEQDKAEAFLEAVREGTTPPATPADAVRATTVVQAAYESARRGERVELD
jgi:predicted dehydrogenase